MSGPDRTATALVALAWLASVAVSVAVVGSWALRVGYPYDLEWMEGGMLAHAWWVLRGEPLYGPPNPEFVPYLYPPGYTALLAGLGRVGGLTLPLGRAVSIAATLAAVAALGAALRRRGARWWVVAVAAATFLGTWPSSGTFMDLTRPDALGVALLAWSVALAVDGRRGTDVAAGLLLAAAYLVKHNLAAFGFPLVVAVGWRSGWGAAARLGLAAALPAGLATAVLTVASDGHLWRYLVEVPLSHPTVGGIERVMRGPRELGAPVPVVLGALSGASLVRLLAEVRTLPRWALSFVPVGVGMAAGWWGTYEAGYGPESLTWRVPAGIAWFAIGALPVVAVLWAVGVGLHRRRGEAHTLPWTWALIGGLVATAIGLAMQMRSHYGGFLNVNLPAHWVLALTFGWLLARWDAAADLRLRRLAPALAVLQLGWMAAILEPTRWIPDAEDRAFNDRLVELLRDADGPVLSPFSAWLPTYAGHPPSLHYMGLWDLEHEGGPYHEARGPVGDAVAAHRWGTVVGANRPFPYQLMEHYEVDVKLLEDAPPPEEGRPDGAPPVGYPVRAVRLLVPRR